MLATLDFGKAINASGVPIEPRPEYNNSTFRCVLLKGCYVFGGGGGASELTVHLSVVQIARSFPLQDHSSVGAHSSTGSGHRNRCYVAFQ